MLRVGYEMTTEIFWHGRCLHYDVSIVDCWLPKLSQLNYFPGGKYRVIWNWEELLMILDKYVVRSLGLQSKEWHSSESLLDVISIIENINNRKVGGSLILVGNIIQNPVA